MDRMVNEKYAELIRKIPEQDYDMNRLMGVFREYISSIAEQYGLVYFKNYVLTPQRGTGPQFAEDTSMQILYQAQWAGKCSEKKYTHLMGNGGHVDVVIGIRQDVAWSSDRESDMEVLAKTSFLLLGRSHAMSDLEKAVLYDPITDLYNKNGMYRKIGGMVESGAVRDMCVNFLNIRNMKLFNDRYKETGGNVILWKYGHAILEFVGKSGVTARVGGDNFIAILEASRQEEFLRFLNNLHVDMIGKNGIPTRVKIDSRVGYNYPQKGEAIPDALENASIALRYAKKYSNPDVMKFEDSMRTQMFQIKQLEDDIPGALEREEFAVYYQPKAYMPGEGEFHLCGAEALVRWFKDGEMIPPGDFIPLLEENGMVVDLDFYMLEHVCRDIRSWEEKGLKIVPISVNFSRRHLAYDDIAERIRDVIVRSGVKTSSLEIEITESYDENDMGTLSRFEQKMHEYGINVSVDDFGSGYSSLRMIKNIEADTIKLDKSLVDGIVDGTREDGIVVSHIIRLVRELGKAVIAEGVESAEQAEFLRRNDCCMIQGYLYGRPMPWEAFEKKLAEG